MLATEIQRPKSSKQIIQKDNWVLVHETSGMAVYIGEELTDFRGVKEYAMGGEPPHKSSSTGRIFVGSNHCTYYPGVFNCKWVYDV
jgi:hypothetical protein